MKIFGMELMTESAIMQRMASFTQIVLGQWREQRANSDDPDVSATAAVEFGLMRYAMGFASAVVNPLIPALNAEYRASIPRDLMLTGNHVAAIFVSPQTGLRLARVSQYDIQGGNDPASWMYHLTLAGPNGGESFFAQPSQVIHVRINASPIEPWRGRSPLENAHLTALALARTEERLGDEMNAETVNLITRPFNPNTQDKTTEARMKAAKGRSMVVQNNPTSDWRNGGGGGAWSALRIGPDPPVSLNDLRGSTSADVLSAMGIPAGLYQPREGAVSREAYRQLLAASIDGLSETIVDELRLKLNQPTLSFSFHALRAADVAANARAFGVLVREKDSSGNPLIPMAQALVYAGLERG